MSGDGDAREDGRGRAFAPEGRAPAVDPEGRAPAVAPEGRASAFDPRMLEALVCPQTHGPLHYDAGRQELVSRAAGLAYPIRDGIPVMLVDEARVLD